MSEESIFWLKEALDQIEQYQLFGEEMRKIGRGFIPSSQFSPVMTKAALKAIIEVEENRIKSKQARG